MATVAGTEQKEAGNRAYHDGDYQEAIHCYSEAIKLNPMEPAYYSNRSAAYCKLNSFRAAIEDAQKAIKLRPQWGRAHFRLGEAYAGLGLNARAADAFETAMQCDPDDQSIKQAYEKCIDKVKEKAQQEESENIVQPLRHLDKQFKTLGDTYSLDNSLSTSKSSYVNESCNAEMKSRHNAIIRDRLSAGTGVSSMEDYMRFRNAGGARLSADPNASPYISTQVPVNAKRQAPIDHSGSEGGGVSNNKSYERRGQTPEDVLTSLGFEEVGSTNSYGGGVSSTPSSTGSTSSILSKQRQQFMDALRTNGQSPGLSNDWLKIKGDTSTKSTTATLTNQSASPTSGDPSRAEFLKRMGIGNDDMSMPEYEYKGHSVNSSPAYP